MDDITDTGVPSPTSDSSQLSIKIQYGKKSADLKRCAESTVSELKAEVEKLFGVPPELQKLMYRGLLKGENESLEKAGLKSGSKVLLIGTSREDLKATSQVKSKNDAGLAWDAPKEQEQPLCQQPQHQKVLAKGRPDDGLPGSKERQVPLEEGRNSLPGLLNSQGNKVRLTFRPDLQQIWIGSATSTQKVPYASIHNVETFPIEGQEEYSIMTLQLGSSSTSKYWLYYVPSQYVAAIKMRILGISALL